MTTWQRWSVALVTSLALSGCFKINTQADFKADGSAYLKSTIDASALMAMAKEMDAEKAKDAVLNCAEAQKDLPEGFVCKDIKEGVIEYSGTLAADAVAGLKREGTTWQLDVLQFFKGMNKAAQGPLGDKKDMKLEPAQAAMMRGMGMAMDLELTLPGKILTVDGKPHTGEPGHVKIDLLESLSKDQYLVTANVTPSWVIPAAIGAGVLVLVVLILVVRRRRN